MIRKGTPVVLVVEDYSDSRYVLSTLLRANGYLVVEAKDGREGLVQANRVNPDLILMDLALPKMDGVEATRQLRRRHTLSQIPIFAITAYATGSVKADALAAGCTEVFPKPFNVDLLLNRIRQALEKRAA